MVQCGCGSVAVIFFNLLCSVLYNKHFCCLPEGVDEERHLLFGIIKRQSTVKIRNIIGARSFLVYCEVILEIRILKGHNRTGSDHTPRVLRDV